MNANEMLDFYITEITNRLPRRNRKDVGTELRALLQEELQDALAQADPQSEVEVARKILANFGHPREVAARYRNPIEIIDPVDAHSFVYASVMGIIIVWTGGLASLLGRPGTADGGYIRLLQSWWFEFGIAALWWPGFLLVMFAIAYQVRKRTSTTRAWRPRKVQIRDPDRINRIGLVAMSLFFAAGLVALISPTSILDLAYGGRAAPAAYDALRYDPDFYPDRGIWLLGILICDLLILLPLIYLGRWTSFLRRLDLIFSFATCFLIVWISALGNIFMAEETDQFVKLAIGIIVLVSLIDKGALLYRELNRNQAFLSCGLGKNTSG